MSYTVPYGQPQGYPYFFTNKLREGLIGEIVAINGYAGHIANSNMEEVNSVWRKILQDEKKHYGMFLRLIRKYDPEEYRKYIEHADVKFAGAPMQAYKPEFDRQLILNNIREDIKGELEAVILYEQHLIEIPYTDIRAVLRTIINSEKGHTEHLTRLLLKYDTDKYDGLK